jgi:hypothetical protein
MTLNINDILVNGYIGIGSDVPKGTISIPSVYAEYNGEKITLNSKDFYTTKSKDFIVKTYEEKEIINEEKDYFSSTVSIFMNIDDVYEIAGNYNYQVDLFVNEIKNIDSVENDIEKMDMKAINLSDTKIDSFETFTNIFNVISLIGIIITLVILFFLSYFVINLIIKSRKVYYATLRILGVNKKECFTILNTEMLSIMNISYFTVVALIQLSLNNIIKVEFLGTLFKYLNFGSYVILYLVLLALTYLLSMRFSKNLFKKTAMATYRNED